VFFASVLLLFAIVCLNTGSLLLLRSTERAFETSVRLALGASWLRVARQSLAEVAAICFFGGAAGLLIAFAAIRVLSRGGQFGDLHFAAPVFAFGAVMTVLTTAICAVYPIWAVARCNPSDALTTSGHQRTGSRGKQHWRRALVTVQVAASTVLLAMGGLLLHSYAHLLQTPLGFDAERVMTMQISLPALKYPSESSRRIFYNTLRNEIRRVPGVTGASACTLLPFGYGETAQAFQIAGQPGTAALPFADVNKVLPGFFHTLRIPLLAGRYLDERDRPGSEPAILIDQNLARQYFPGKNPLGRQIELSVGHRFSVAGVVRNIKVDGLDITNRPMLYFSALQTPVTDMSLIVKTSQALDRLPEIVQDIVAKVDSGQPVYDIAPLTARVDQSLSTRRFVLFLLMSFAVTGTAITAIGLYGLLSYSVVIRRREFGIRAAVGAKPADLAVLVFRHGFLLVVLGAAVGGLAAVSASRYLSSELYGVRVSDPFTWVSIAIVLATTATLACLHPSWRASHTNPLSLLKQD
jgi:predicted permease